MFDTQILAGRDGLQDLNHSITDTSQPVGNNAVCQTSLNCSQRYSILKNQGMQRYNRFQFGAMDHVKQMMASRSDAPFKDAKAKLMEIRSQQAKRMASRADTKMEKKRKKKQKKTEEGHGHALF